jgi:fructose-bisphosphate aldolase, class II
MSTAKSLSNNKTLSILKAAEEGNYGVVSPVIYNVEHIIGSVRAAEAKNAPLILEMFPWALTFSDGLLVHAAAQAARQAQVPVSVHLDHAQDEALIRQAADTLPFDSIMVDMSHYDREDNLRKTKELAAYCKERGIAVEAEPGRIEGGEDGIKSTEDLEAVMTTLEDVHDFYTAGVDILAPSIGNIHGSYGSNGPQLDLNRYSLSYHWKSSLIIDRLNNIHVAVRDKMVLALHGTTGVSEHLLRECISKGVRKVNINKGVLGDYLQHIKTNSATLPLTKLMEKGVDYVQRSVESYIEICGSTGKGMS